MIALAGNNQDLLQTSELYYVVSNQLADLGVSRGILKACWFSLLIQSVIRTDRRVASCIIKFTPMPFNIKWVKLHFRRESNLGSNSPWIISKAIKQGWSWDPLVCRSNLLAWLINWLIDCPDLACQSRESKRNSNLFLNKRSESWLSRRRGAVILKWEKIWDWRRKESRDET